MKASLFFARSALHRQGLHRTHRSTKTAGGAAILNLQTIKQVIRFGLSVFQPGCPVKT